MIQQLPTSHPDGLTILRARGRRLAKLLRADGTTDSYDLARRFDLLPATIADFSSLVLLLHRLAGLANCAVVRGAIADPDRVRGVRRLLHPDTKTGDSPTLCEVRRAWVALDMDGLRLPADCDWRDLEACGAVARAALPRAFQPAALVVVATASHGLKPGARLRLWALLKTPLTGAELTRWLHGAACDPSVFRAAQPIYTASPVFQGISDPIADRLVVLPGQERVACPSPASLAPPPIRSVTAEPPKSGAPGAGKYAATALARATRAVAMASVDTRHCTAVRESLNLAKLVAAGLLAGSDVSRAIDSALQQAGKPPGEGGLIAAWAMAQRGGSGAAR